LPYSAIHDAPGQQLVVTLHVQQRHLAHHGVEELGPLQHHRAHQQAAIAATLDAQVRG
jgi:hypothetical protein